MLRDGTDRVVKPSKSVWLVGYMDHNGLPVLMDTQQRVLASALKPGHVIEAGGKRYQTTFAGEFGAVVWPLA